MRMLHVTKTILEKRSLPTRTIGKGGGGMAENAREIRLGSVFDNQILEANAKTKKYFYPEQ